MVSIGILVLLFSLAGEVFTLTIQSTGQATALNEVNQALRAFEQTLREDLRHVRAGQSVLLIQANPVNAYWTATGKASDTDDDPSNGYAHGPDPGREERDLATGELRLVKPRADILTFFTARKGVSFVDPKITSNLQQVVYGHAELRKWTKDATGTGARMQPPVLPPFPSKTANGVTYPDPDGKSQVPAEAWHLGRRSVLIVPNAIPDTGTPPKARAVHAPNDPSKWLGDVRLLQGELDVVDNFSFQDMVLTPYGEFPGQLPKILSKRDDVDPDRRDPLFDSFARSQLDENPAMQWANRMGHYLLPRCASFKVEWTLDARGEFVDGRLDGSRELHWLDPGLAGAVAGTGGPLSALSTAMQSAPAQSEERERLRSLLEDRTWHPDGGYYSLGERFASYAELDSESYWKGAAPPTPDGRPNVAFFGAARRAYRPGPDGVFGTADDETEIVPEDVFPSALRITIDLYDAQRRLGYPVRHVMVIPVGY